MEEKNTENAKEDSYKKANIAKSASRINYWVISTVILVVLLSVSILTDGFRLNKEQNEPNITANVIAGSSINFIIINDKTCSDCDTSQIITVTKQLFSSLETKEIDVNSKEGKKLVEKYTLEKVPSYLFSINIESTESYKNPQVSGAFEKRSDMYKLMDAVTGASHFIDPAKQAAFEAKLAEEKKLAMKKLNIGDKPQIDFFVMSYCPYGNQAEEAVEQVFKVLGDKAVFMPRYVIYSNYQGGGPNYCIDKENKYCSMHGAQELNQGIREKCVLEEYGTSKMFEFMLEMNNKCSAGNADTCWNSVAAGLGIDAAKVSKCEKERGLKIAADEKELNDLMKVSGSPSVFINGIAYNGARTAQGYLNALCAEFKDKPAECSSAVVQADQPAQQPVQGGCG